jgi:hypothetical protein
MEIPELPEEDDERLLCFAEPKTYLSDHIVGVELRLSDFSNNVFMYRVLVARIKGDIIKLNGVP